MSVVFCPLRIWGIGYHLIIYWDFPDSSGGKEYACNAGDPSSIPGVGKIHWRRERLPTSVFWPGEFHGLDNEGDHKESDMRE